MTKTTFTVTAPDGQVLKRNTDRVYTHAIIGRPSLSWALANASIISKTDKENFEYHVAVSSGTHEHSIRRNWQTEEGHAEDMRCHAAEAAKAPTAQAYAELMRADRLAIVEARRAAGAFDTFIALTWCGRPDLAAKELAKASSGGYWDDVSAIPATVKGR